MQPEDRIKRRERHVGHVTSVANEDMNHIVNVFETVVVCTTIVQSCIRKDGIIGNAAKQLVGEGLDTAIRILSATLQRITARRSE